MSSKTIASKLGDKQQRFVEEYIVDLNGAQAAARAGYSPKTAHVQGSRLLTKAKVQAAISVALKEREGRTEVSQDFVIQWLVENLKRAMQQRPVLDKSGEPTGQYTYNGSVANRSLELLGRHLGMFGEGRKPPGEDFPRRMDISELTPAEVRMFADEYKRSQGIEVIEVIDVTPKVLTEPKSL